MSTLKVNVVLLAYNHEQFIGQALDGILAQQVDFAYTILVGEDCSTDQTRTIVESYRQRYPERIQPLYHPQNVGPGANLKACLAACQAPYIAFLDGDDYWTDPLKLAKQVQWLDANPDCAICFHHVEVMRANSADMPLLPPATTRTVYTFTDLLSSMMPPTGAVMLRNSRASLPDWLFGTYPLDLPLFILYSETGYAKLLPEVMGRYRIHPASTWSTASAEGNQRKLFAMLQLLQLHYTPTPYNRRVRQAIGRKYLTAADEYVQQGLAAKATPFLKDAFQLWRAYTPSHAKSLLGVSLRWMLGRARSSKN